MNQDGSQNILDIVMIATYILGPGEFSGMQVALADINLDGAINILDLVNLANIILSRV